MTSPTAYLPLRSRMMRAGCWPEERPDSPIYHQRLEYVDGYGATKHWQWGTVNSNSSKPSFPCRDSDAANTLRIAAVEWLLLVEGCSLMTNTPVWFIQNALETRSWQGPDLDAALIAALSVLLPEAT